MKLFRQLVAYVLLAGTIIPTFSIAINKTKRVAQVALNAANGVKDTVDEYVEFHNPITVKETHINEEVRAIKRVHIDRENNRLFHEMYDELRRDCAPFRALVDLSDRTKKACTALEQELAQPGVTPVRRDQIISRLSILDAGAAEIELEIDLYFRLYELYGFAKLDVQPNGQAVHAGPYAKNNAICNTMIRAINVPAQDVIIFPTVAAPNNRAHGIVKGVLYPVTKTITKKIILVNVAAFNRLFATQKADRISHTLAQFVHEESQWSIFKKDNRARALYWAKKMPWIIMACGLVYYYGTGGDVLPYVPTTLVDAYNMIVSACSTPQEVVPVSTVDQFYNAVTVLLEKMGIITPEVVDATYFEQLKAIIAPMYEQTPYLFKTASSALVSSWIIRYVGFVWNRIYNTIDSYRADKIVCQKRGPDGYAGVYERVGYDVANDNGGMTRLWYLWIQKKLGLI